MSKRIYNAFGYLWQFNFLQQDIPLTRIVLLPTISVFCEQTTYAGYDVRYWNFDLMWLRHIMTIEVEQLELKK